MTREQLAEQIQVLRISIRSLQSDQWDCGYSDARANRITELRIVLNYLLETV